MCWQYIISNDITNYTILDTTIDISDDFVGGDTDDTVDKIDDIRDSIVV